MADPIDAGGVDAFAYLYTTRIPDIVAKLIDIQGFAIDRGLGELRQGVTHILNGLLDDINEVAVETAARADALIITKMIETQSRNRPFTGSMESHVHSSPGPLGSVNVALIDELDKIVNQRGDYGPFWRAQEFGTGNDKVPSQEGRVIFGTFEPSNSRPLGQYRGLGVGRDLAFVPGGADPGFGTINEELPGRHFLTDGATEAAARYREQMKGIERKYIAELKSLVDAAVATRGRRFMGRIEA